ncbi:cysteine desulfurase/sulfurtransferase TusA family protein [Rarobacter incanus]
MQSGIASLWGDPHHDHAYGRQARRGLDAARETIAGVVGARRDDVIVTSSLTQALNTVVGAASAARRRRFGSRILVQESARTSALHAAYYFGDAQTVPVDSAGIIDAGALAQRFAAGTSSLFLGEHANVESGAIQDLPAVFAACDAVGVPSVIDASVTAGRLEIPSGWDALVLDAGEWGAGFRLGFVVARPSTRLRPVWPPDAEAWFPGGISAPLAFTAAVALEHAVAERAAEQARIFALSAILRAELESVEGVCVVGPPEPSRRMAHIVSVALQGADGEAVARELGKAGYAVGTGSACTSSTIEPNHVLRAMGVAFDGHLRFTLDHQSVESDVVGFGPVLDGVLRSI